MRVVEHIRSESRFIHGVERERLVFSDDLASMVSDEWVSLVTFDDHGTSTLVVHREQCVFLAYTDDGAHDITHLRGSVYLAWNALDVALG